MSGVMNLGVLESFAALRCSGDRYSRCLPGRGFSARLLFSPTPTTLRSFRSSSIEEPSLLLCRVLLLIFTFANAAAFATALDRLSLASSRSTTARPGRGQRRGGDLPGDQDQRLDGLAA